jgi:hypothetical protein
MSAIHRRAVPPSLVHLVSGASNYRRRWALHGEGVGRAVGRRRGRDALYYNLSLSLPLSPFINSFLAAQEERRIDGMGRDAEARDRKGKKREERENAEK